ncbi:2-dehydro-3-deoxyphosphooctonate aldolase [Striga asiatica]|uniref:2-dehydro-3-deoxyphosphooctonate aldolase n=1 Tax=Striga asiatica TaxID=4170 RepID=A0A5A7PAQ2_STRAF|nr:2-dehydro-3-deoxyphosphooctonate aldolase [Striga asiatica]
MVAQSTTTRTAEGMYKSTMHKNTEGQPDTVELNDGASAVLFGKVPFTPPLHATDRDSCHPIEVTRPDTLPHPLIIRIKRIRRMRHHSIRLIARPTRLQQRAVHPPRPAGPIQARLQHLLIRSFPRHTISLIHRIIRKNRPRPRQPQRVHRHPIPREKTPISLRNRLWP